MASDACLKIDGVRALPRKGEGTREKQVSRSLIQHAERQRVVVTIVRRSRTSRRRRPVPDQRQRFRRCLAAVT